MSDQNRDDLKRTEDAAREISASRSEEAVESVCAHCRRIVDPGKTIHDECKGPAAEERRLHRVIAASAMYANALSGGTPEEAIAKADRLLAALDAKPEPDTFHEHRKLPAKAKPAK